jgi:hypothetical protein
MTTATPSRPGRPRGRVALVATVAALLALAAAWLSRRPPAAGSLVIAVAETRSFEPRVSWPAADRHRWLLPARGGDRPHEAVPPATLAALRNGGDPRALAAAELLAGAPAEAARALARAGDGADVRSDRAAAALAAGQAAEALQLADAALTRQPGHAQASWNRALALRDLGLPLAAAAQLDSVAALGEPGWSDEARARAAVLRDEANRRARAWHALVTAGKIPPDAAALRASLTADNAAAALAEARRQGWWGVERDALSLLSHATSQMSVAAAYAAEASLRAPESAK